MYRDFLFYIAFCPPKGRLRTPSGQCSFRGNLGPYLFRSISSNGPPGGGGPQTRVCLGATKGVNPPLHAVYPFFNDISVIVERESNYINNSKRC